MTARELIKAIQDIAGDDLDKEVWHHDEYEYVPIDAVSLYNDSNYNTFAGCWEEKTVIAID